MFDESINRLIERLLVSVNQYCMEREDIDTRISRSSVTMCDVSDVNAVAFHNVCGT